MKKEELQLKIGQRIVKLREKMGWSQSDLARACNKDRQSIERIESGNINPSIFALHEIANGLGVSLSEIVDI